MCHLTNNFLSNDVVIIVKKNVIWREQDDL
jgi:hypothetical protein